MKVNVNVLIGCVLCILMMALVGVMHRASEDHDGWRPSDVYSHVGTVSHSDVSVASSGSSDNVLVSMRGGRAVGSSRRVVPAPVFSYAPVAHGPSPIANRQSSIASTQYPIGGTPSNSVASPVYTTSSATMKSFGGGAMMDAAVWNTPVRSTSSQSFAAAPGVVSLPSTMLTYYPFAEGAYGADVAVAASAFQDVNTTAGGVRGIAGRRNLGENMGSSYDSWLNWFNKFGWAYGSCPDNDNHYYYDDAQLRAAYAAWIATLSPQMPRPSYEEWLSWFASEEHYHEDGKYFSFVPVGDIWPLIVLIMLYTLFIVIRKSFKTTCI